MEEQFIVTHTIRQIQILALLDSWVTDTPPVNTLHPQNFAELNQNVLVLQHKVVHQECAQCLLSPVKL